MKKIKFATKILPPTLALGVVFNTDAQTKVGLNAINLNPNAVFDVSFPKNSTV